jgi:FkbM family methyltransferase
MSRRVERALSKGGYERQELQLIGALLSPADVVLEIGAGLGLISTFCAKRVGPSRVFAFEADPDLEPCIRETYALNGVEPTLDMCAVGVRAGRVTIYRNKHLVSSSVGRRRAGTRPVEVPGKALNYVVHRFGPTVLIINADGVEPELFDGAELPTVTKIMVELPDLVLGPQGTNRVRAALAKLGFREDRGLTNSQHLVLRRLPPN